MKILQLKKENADTVLEEALQVLRSGGVILYPTDTLYGLGADAFSDTAIDKVYAIKAREKGKPVYAIVETIEVAERYAEVTETARTLIEKFLPGPLALVLQKKQGIEGGVARGMDTFGIRIPNHAFCLALAQKFGKPYTTTSANIAGKLPERSVEGILEQLGDRASFIDLVIDGGDVKDTTPSTIVDVSSGIPEVIREGAIPSSQIFSA